MPSPADREVQLRADVERIARDLFETSIAEWKLTHVCDPREWDRAHEDERDHMRRTVRSLLTRDTIRVGRRPVVPEQMEGQTSIDDIPPDRGRVPRKRAEMTKWDDSGKRVVPQGR